MPSTATILAIPALLVLLFLSVSTMHLQPKRNGYAVVLNDILKDPAPRFLPDTDRLLLRHYTGIEKVDEILALLNLIFAHTSDWSRPEFALYCLQFGGQAIALFLIFNIESLKVGSRWTLVSGPLALIWGMASQLAGYTCAVPVFAIIHLLTVANQSNKTATARISDPLKVEALVPGYLLGFVVPTLASGVPFEDHSYRQIANAVWQFFPIWVYIFTQVFAFFWKQTSVGENMSKSPIARERAALAYTYDFALTFAAISHWAICGVIVTAQLAPGIFPEGFASHFNWSDVFLPTKFITDDKFESGGQVVHDMFRYDQILGGASALIWAVVYCVETGAIDIDTYSIYGIFRDTLLVGPGGALVNLLKSRDEALLEAAEEPSEKKSQ